MAETKRRSLDVPEDMRFQERTWTVERIGWVAMTIAVLLALLGLFSRGPLSDVRAKSADGTVEVEYERFAHRTARADFTIRVAAAQPPETRIRISPAFTQAYDIESLSPQPLRSSAGTSGLEMVFAPSAGGDLSVHLAARGKRFGLFPITVEVEGRGSVSFTHVIYP